MKRHVQFPGIRKWSGDDLMELQGEGLSIADRFFSQYGNCVICGCIVSDDKISAGLVTIDGIVMPFEGVNGIEVFPVYLVKSEKHVQREYADDVVRDIAVEYYAKKVQEKPTDGYIEITKTGAPFFFDNIKSTWLTDVLKQLEDLAKNDTNIWDTIKLLQNFDTKATDQLVKLEKKMPSFLNHTPTVDDNDFDIGTEVWTIAENGVKTFWKCYDNTKGKAVWKSSDESELILGETEGTAYEGSKGKANADAIRILLRSKVVYLKDFTTSNIQSIMGVTGDKWYLTDTKKIREVTSVDADGFIRDTIEYAPLPESIFLKKGDPDKIYLFSTENGMTPMSGEGGLIIGETEGTAYEGAKGKANADAIRILLRSKVVYLKDFTTSNIQSIMGVTGDKWYLTDTKKIREVTSVDADGFIRDTIEYAPLPESIFLKGGDPDKIYLFSTENGMTPMSGEGGLIIGETEGTAYEGSKGKANADAIAKINRSNVVYLQGFIEDVKLADGKLGDKYYVIPTKNIREIVGFTTPNPSPITKDYDPYENSIYLKKGEPSNIYLFDSAKGMFLALQSNNPVYLEGSTISNIINQLVDKNGVWTYNKPCPFFVDNPFLNNFNTGIIEIVPMGDSDTADDFIKITVALDLKVFNEFTFVISTNDSKKWNTWMNYSLSTVSKPCGPINYTQLKKFTGNFGLDGFQLFSIMQGSEWVYSPTPEEIKDNELTGVYSYGGLIKVMFRDGSGMEWYNLHFYSGNNYHETLPDASLNSEDWNLSVNPTFEDMFLAASKGSAKITDDTSFIGKTGNDEYSVFYVTEIVEAGEGIQYSLYYPSVSNGNITFSRKESIFKVNISSDTTFTITVEDTGYDFPKNLIINQTLVSQMTFPDNIVWLETPDFSQPGVYHVEFKICVQDPTKLLALVTFKEPDVL